MDAVILNAGPGAWAFEPLASRLSQVLALPVFDAPARFNYVLGWDESLGEPSGESFIPFSAMRLANDKRLGAECFARHDVPTPETLLVDTEVELQQILAARGGEEWVLKWPVGCGASGHRMMAGGDSISSDWPRPFVLQKFVRLERPEVFRLYSAGGKLFGWNARRFPKGQSTSPFVAHARGARYEDAGDVPAEALEVARAALQASGLLYSFGCADLMRDADGRWLALEVNTDGVWVHVDRDVPQRVGLQIEEQLHSAVTLWLHKQEACT